VRPGCGPSKALEMFFVSFSFPSSFLSLIFYFFIFGRTSPGKERKGKQQKSVYGSGSGHCYGAAPACVLSSIFLGAILFFWFSLPPQVV
jgi:hypothetical protein